MRTLQRVLFVWAVLSGSLQAQSTFDHDSRKSSSSFSQGAGRQPRSAAQLAVQNMILGSGGEVEAKKILAEGKKFLSEASLPLSGDEAVLLCLFQIGANFQKRARDGTNGWRKADHILDSLISRGVLTEGAILFRGRFSASEAEEVAEGKTFKVPHYISTSVDPLISKKFTKGDPSYFDVIQVDRAGLRGLDVVGSRERGQTTAPTKDIIDIAISECHDGKGASHFNRESEVILPPGAKFRVLKIERKSHGGRNWVIRYLEYIGN